MAENNNEVHVLTKQLLGDINVADEAIAVIAGVAAVETDGVASLTGKIKRDDICRLGLKALSKGIKITVNENVVSIFAGIEVKSNSSIPAVCAAVQDRVKSSLENMTGLTVTEVNVVVTGVVD